MQINLKYFDPGCAIRSVPALAPDSIDCFRLAQNAVCAALSGRTRLVIGRRHDRYVHLPMTLMAEGRKQSDSHGDLWLPVLEAKGQPRGPDKEQALGFLL